MGYSDPAQVLTNQGACCVYTCYFIKSVLTNVLTGDLQQFVNKTDMPG